MTNSNGTTPHKVIDNPNPHHFITGGENATPLEVIGSTATDKLVIVMVGLPATGKTHIAKRICRFLNFFHDIDSQIFNVGDYRRKLCGEKMPASFFDPQNADGLSQRKMACDAALKDMLEYMNKPDVRVAVYDATNSTKERRDYLAQRIQDANVNAKIMYIESICDNEELLEANIRKVKLATPDYRDADPEEAVKDFHVRRNNYASVYEPLSDEKDYNLPFIKIFNCKKFVVNNIRGYLKLKIVHFVMNLHTLQRTFYLSRHGQSEYNILGKIGGDSSLSVNGKEYAKRLAKYAEENICRTTETDLKSGEEKTVERPARLWTSTLKRTNETVQFVNHKVLTHTWDNGDTNDWVQLRQMPKPNLDEIYAGTCDGMTYKEIEETYPEEFARRQSDKLTYRYPRGESYMDVTLRLEPLAHEMERTREPILIVGHQGIHRILYAYFMGLTREEAPYVSIPLNTIIKLSPHAYGCDETRICLMDKSEMLNDGQDEPVTSMPVGGKKYDPLNDPIMNAPSH